jgi:predicted nuclease of predicted toxin-antitoxin system
VEFLADESCAGSVIRALRAAGHDLVVIAEEAKGALDEWVMERAFAESRILITGDRDFGELVYASGRSTAGVVFVKFHSRARRAKPEAVLEAVAKLGDDYGAVSRSLNPDGFDWPNERESKDSRRRNLESRGQTY